MELFSQDEDDPTCLSEFEFRGSTQKGPLSYEDLVKDLISEEKAFLRELKMVKKVFRPVLEKMCPAPVPGNGVSPEEMAAVFGEIDDVYNTSMDFVDSLEDALEMDSQSGGGWIGVRSVFEDIIEAQEFDVFRNYAVELLSAPNGRENGSTSPGLPAFETLNLILNRPFVERHLKVKLLILKNEIQAGNIY
jgi:son of sevenless